MLLWNPTEMFRSTWSGTNTPSVRELAFIIYSDKRQLRDLQREQTVYHQAHKETFIYN